jgi:hypothetical protein
LTFVKRNKNQSFLGFERSPEGEKFSKQNCSQAYFPFRSGGNPRLNNGSNKGKQIESASTAHFPFSILIARETPVILESSIETTRTRTPWARNQRFFLDDEKRKTVSTLNNKMTTYLDLPL